MMKVNEVSNKNDLSLNKTKKLSGGTSFASYLNNVSEQQMPAISGINSISGMDAIFATQMADNIEEREKRKKLLKRAHTLLDKLEDIRSALLVGHMPIENLINISRLVKEQREMCEDTKLLEIIEEIELRVEVELAKLTK